MGRPAGRVRGEMFFPRRGIERITRYGFERARALERKKVTLVDKSNAITIQQLWRDVLEEVAAEYPDVQHDAMYVDAACMWLAPKPEQVSVIVTPNLFGDLITHPPPPLRAGLGP